MRNDAAYYPIGYDWGQGNRISDAVAETDTEDQRDGSIQYVYQECAVYNGGFCFVDRNRLIIRISMILKYEPRPQSLSSILSLALIMNAVVELYLAVPSRRTSGSSKSL